MGKIILLSSKVVWNAATAGPHPGIVDAINAVAAAGSHVALISRHGEPPWFKQLFPTKTAHIFHVVDVTRGDGQVVQRVITGNPELKLSLDDFIVIGATDKDMHMAANARVLLLQPLWVPDREAAMHEYGVPFKAPADLPHVVELLTGKVPWFFEHDDGFASIRALTNANTAYASSQAIAELATSLKVYLKDEHALRAGLQLHLLSSIYKTPELCVKGAIDVWGYFPSSSSKNDDAELMAGITHRVRQPLKVLTAKLGAPLLIRHTASAKRHVGGAGSRTDATGQLTTLHLNPAYKKKLKGATVAVLDDFTTYGCSFGVTTALLRAAGAKRVHCIAIGKYGSQLRSYPIRITGDPFLPLQAKDFTLGPPALVTGSSNPQAQFEFFEKFGRAIS